MKFLSKNWKAATLAVGVVVVGMVAYEAAVKMFNIRGKLPSKATLNGNSKMKKAS